MAGTKKAESIEDADYLAVVISWRKELIMILEFLIFTKERRKVLTLK